MKTKLQMFLLLLALLIGCDDGEKIADLTKDVEDPDLTPDVSEAALYTDAQQQQIEDFQAAREQFKDMTRAEFDETYGPAAAYSDTLGYNPNEALNLELITAATPIEDAARTAYETNGFVVLKDKKYESFFQGLIDVYTKDLPVYFSVDAMLDALHLSFDRMLMDLEMSVLKNDLAALLDKMTASLSDAPSASSLEIGQSYDDAAVWICVGQSLLEGEKQSCLRGQDSVANAYLKYIEEEKPAEVPIFGKMSTEDFSQFKPRGHYTKTESLKRYFQAVMWIERTGLDFAKYSRHARLAYLLSDLMRSGGGGDDYDRIDDTVEALVGVSDSMNANELLDVAAASDIDSLEDLTDQGKLDAFVAAALKSGAGEQRINSTFLAADQALGTDEFTPIPPLFYFMGQRFIVDSYVFVNVVYDRVKEPVERYMPSPLDTWFVLGNKETVPLLADELDTYQYQSNLATLDYLVTTYDDAFWQENFYNAWLSALMSLDEDVTGDAYPTVMRTRTWQHRMLNTQLTSWAHLRHDTLLYAKPSYDMAGCDYPDAWVDAYPAFFETIADISELASASLSSLGIFDISVETEEASFYGSELQYYFTQLKEVSLMLKDIADAEIRQAALSTSQLEFMNQLINDESVCGAPPYSGWYSDIIYKLKEENMEVFDPTVADVHTSSNTTEVLHVATGNPNLMVLSVATDCQLRAYAGPVLSYHEIVTTDFERLDDETWKTMLLDGQESRPTWTESFVW